MKTNRLAALSAAMRKQQPAQAEAAELPQIQPNDIPRTPTKLVLTEAERAAERRDERRQFRYFENFAVQLFDKGWMPVPQTRIGDRRPGLVDRRGLQWGQYTIERPGRRTVEHWSRDPDAGHCNIAVILGEPSRNTFGIDVDVLGDAHNNIVQQAAVEVFGDTMIRYGNKPKALMLYRVADPSELPAYGKFVIAGDDGQPNGDIVEILGHGRMVTFVGLHHTTGELFQFDGGMPQYETPEQACTLVTGDQIKEFFRLLAARVQLFVPPRAQNVEFDIESVDADGIRVPHVKAWSGNEWIEQDGLVSDGREAFIYSLAREFARANAGADMDTLVPLVVRAFLERQHPSRAWSQAKAIDHAKEKVVRALRAIHDGRLKPSRKKEKTTAVVQPADVVEPIERRAPEVRTEGPAMSFLPRRRRSGIKVKFSLPDPAKAITRALRADRDVVGDEAAAKNMAGIDAFIDDVMSRNPRVHVLSGTTGIGKSSMTLKRLATRRSNIFDRIAVHEDENEAAEELGGLVMLVPTYNNIEDLRLKASMLNLDGTASDDELVAAAEAQGIVADGDAQDHLEQLKRFAVSSGLSYMIYKGKVAAGCLRAEEMRLLQSSNVPTSAMCKTKVHVKDSQGRKTGETEERHCQFYGSCPAIAQRHDLKGKDLVFLVRNFLTLALPDELSSPRGLIVDERFFDLLIHEASMPLSTLDLHRREPVLGKKEWEAGMRPADLLQDRIEAVDHAKDVLLRRGDLARYFLDLVIDRGEKKVRGIELIVGARRVCGSGMTSQADLNPDLTLEQIREICAAPKGTRIGEEYRFWKILEEQVTALQTRYLDSSVRIQPDRRIRVLGETIATDGRTADPDIQLAWRSTPNWTGVPTLLLDASTDPVITSLALGGRDVVVHEAEVNLNQHVVLSVDRRLSMRSLFPGKEAPVEKRVEAASLLHDLRLSIAMYAGAHAHGRVLIVAPMRLRRALLKDWCPPSNVDVRHYGAVAGLDFARRHVAMAFISRLELPTRTVDGLVSALSHGQMEPEAPIDPLGTGQDEDGDDIAHNIVRHAHPLRDGGSAIWDLDEYAGDLARRIQRQYREEQQHQAIGRLRAVYRDDPGMVLGISSTPPRDLVADEVVGLKDLTIGGRFWDAVRISGGVVNARMLARYAPHLGEVHQFEAMIAEHFESNPLIVSRYHRATAFLEDGTEETIYVAGHFQAWRHRLVEELRALEWKGRLSDIRECAVHTPAAEEAPKDKIDEILAAMDAVNGEMRRMGELTDALIARGEWRPGAMNGWAPFRQSDAVKAPAGYRAGSGEYGSRPLPLGVWLALDTIQDAWVRDGMLTPAEMLELGFTEETVKPRKAA